MCLYRTLNDSRALGSLCVGYFIPRGHASCSSQCIAGGPKKGCDLNPDHRFGQSRSSLGHAASPRRTRCHRPSAALQLPLRPGALYGVLSLAKLGGKTTSTSEIQRPPIVNYRIGDQPVYAIVASIGSLVGSEYAAAMLLDHGYLGRLNSPLESQSVCHFGQRMQSVADRRGWVTPLASIYVHSPESSCMAAASYTIPK